MDAEPILTTVRPAHDPASLALIKQLLAGESLGYDDDVEVFVVAKVAARIVGCLGLAGKVVKCAAVDPDYRGRGLAAQMMQEMNYLTLQAGRRHLFLFTKPENRELFEGCGFHFLAEVPDMVTLMENTPSGIQRYCDELRRNGFVPKRRVAGLVINANPFTRGHQYLVKTAAEQCEFVHVFVVREDISRFSYVDRLALVKAGIDELALREKIMVHGGSDYIVSRATFPSYFLKEKADIAKAATGLDLQLFRNYIAPALGINHRYVGTEPMSAITNHYNDQMEYWLQEADSDHAQIRVHILPRIGLDYQLPVISATVVRGLIENNDLQRLHELVPQPTFDLIMKKYLPESDFSAEVLASKTSAGQDEPALSR